MSDRSEKLYVLHGYSPEGETWLSFREPIGTALAVLRKRLGEGGYDKPFLVENREYRSLCFTTDGSVQSEMRLDDPEALVSAYTRKMMGFLLFRRRPRQVLMIGLGGGSLVKYCHRHLPSTRITVVEIDARVIALRAHFQVPPDGPRLRVVNAEGACYVADMARANQRTDVLLVDAFDRRGIATAVIERAFLEDARRILSGRGVFVMNLLVDQEVCTRCIETIRSVFGDPVITVAVESGGNVVVFAGGALRDRRRLVAAIRNARRIEGRLGLHFPTLLQRTNEYRNRLGLQDAAVCR